MAVKKKEPKNNSESLEDEDRFYYNDDSDVQEVVEGLSNRNRFSNSDDYGSY